MKIDIHSMGRAIHASISLPERPEKLMAAPTRVVKGAAGPLVLRMNRDGDLWSHQAKALGMLEAGEHTVIATGTGSGKSLIFQAHTLTSLGKDRDETTIVFNPLRALAEDQLQSWRAVGELCGLDERSIVKIDGSVPIGEREGMLADAAIAIMTPDICQAWLMRNAASRTVRDFIGRLANLVIDEAHVYDSVFGSNAGYLFRRLLELRDRCAEKGAKECTMIAATATISNAAEHMQRLTGRPFGEVTEEDNGARMYPRQIVHVDGYREDDIVEIVEAIARDRKKPKFIAFMDSRQGVERVARRVRGGKVLAYRNGYEAGDRREIEVALRDGNLNGVVSTSALELGINIPGLSVGMNLRTPSTRKAFRQRIGRVGRDGPGTFIIVGPPNLFSQYGETLEQYYEASAEPSILYLNNKYIQFANAQCLAKEAATRADDLDTEIWPAGFRKAVGFTDRNRHPPEFDSVAIAGRRNPHLAHAVRNLPEGEITLMETTSNRKVGTTTLSQAMREAYPGAAYLHRGRRYKTGDWEVMGERGEIQIPITEYAAAERTEPIDRRDVTIAGVLDGHIAMHSDGVSYLAEVNTSIRSEVTGYLCNGRPVAYEQGTMPRREFDTTGVLLRIGAEWAEWAPPRAEIARWLKEVLRYDQSIASWDVENSSDAMTIKSRAKPDGETVANGILIYDETHGSLRLTEALFHHFRRYMQMLERAVEMESEQLPQEVVQNLNEWAAGLEWAG